MSLPNGEASPETSPRLARAAAGRSQAFRLDLTPWGI